MHWGVPSLAETDIMLPDTPLLIPLRVIGTVRSEASGLRQS